MYNMLNVIKGSFKTFQNNNGANSWDILPGLNIALENNLSVFVEGKEYNGEFLQPNKKYRLKSATIKNIVIIGKGDSLLKVDKTSLVNSFIINLNDSEIWQAGNICLFYSDWAFKSIKKNGFKCDLYITNKNIPDGVKHAKVNYKPETHDFIEKSLKQIEQEDFYLTNLLIIPALKIANYVSKILNKRIEIYMIGFDFSNENVSKIKDFSGHSLQYKNILFKKQKRYFSILKSDFDKKYTDKKLKHVGTHSFSDLTVKNFNKTFKYNKNLKNNNFDFRYYYQKLLKKMKNGHAVIVAELTNNHCGDAEKIRKMVRLSKDAGADIVKIQKRNVLSFYTKEELQIYYKSPFGTTLKDYREVELDDELIKSVPTSVQRK